MTAAFTILLVDDITANLDILEDYLENSGYHLASARNGIEAWTLLEREQIGRAHV